MRQQLSPLARGVADTLIDTIKAARKETEVDEHLRQLRVILRSVEAGDLTTIEAFMEAMSDPRVRRLMRASGHSFEGLPRFARGDDGGLYARP